MLMLNVMNITDRGITKLTTTYKITQIIFPNVLPASIRHYFTMLPSMTASTESLAVSRIILPGFSAFYILLMVNLQNNTV